MSKAISPSPNTPPTETVSMLVGEDGPEEEKVPTEQSQEVVGLSKTQLKKLKRKEKWEQVKAEKRKAEKSRRRERKRLAVEQGQEIGPSRKALKFNTMAKSNCGVRVAIDCGFDDLMAERDIKMLVKQIQHSYSANRRAANPLQLYVCGVGGKCRDRLEALGDYKNWDVRFRERNYTELFDKDSIVYLSSESSEVLQTLEEDKVYVIGGLVDHNHHKGICHRLAEEKGLSHAQLPISEYMDMKTRKVLAVNHVFEILLRFTETEDWKKAFFTVIPQRKGASVKQGSDPLRTGTSSTPGDEQCASGGEDSDSDSGEGKHLSVHGTLSSENSNDRDQSSGGQSSAEKVVNVEQELERSQSVIQSLKDRASASVEPEQLDVTGS